MAKIVSSLGFFCLVSVLHIKANDAGIILKKEIDIKGPEIRNWLSEGKKFC
ncbi:hypothetical protein COLO4_03422 [Corchorus olitorius]|uniref:Uncharacterized protein n=1 Tax=Corchorus olitorius TaxID=93759 RepID=A0A1R3JAT1_9ROSI|nr:hypothetical protein COLO4_18042 [Corchorus olitorius]OMP12179.1 hypothetical protein COLO4_03422 [Corchorus olitorius]